MFTKARKREWRFAGLCFVLTKSRVYCQPLFLRESRICTSLRHFLSLFLSYCDCFKVFQDVSRRENEDTRKLFVHRNRIFTILGQGRADVALTGLAPLQKPNLFAEVLFHVRTYQKSSKVVRGQFVCSRMSPWMHMHASGAMQC